MIYHSLKEFKAHCVVKLKLSNNSIRLVLSRLKRFEKWLAANNTDISNQSAQMFLYDLKESGLKNNSINSYVFALRSLNSFLSDSNAPNSGFCDDIESLPKETPTIEILTPHEIELILESEMVYGTFRGMDCSRLNETYRSLTRMLATTGCRYSEAADLLIKHVDLQNKRVIFVETKNKTNRFAYINEPLISELRHEMKDRGRDEYVFLSMGGDKVVPQSYSMDLRKRAKMVGITKRVHPHLFRHSFATELLKSGVDVSMVASVLGHKDIQTTFKNYVHLADTTLMKAVSRHPLVRKHRDPVGIVTDIKEAIESYGVQFDPRFNFNLINEGYSLKLILNIRGSPKSTPNASVGKPAK